MCSLKLYFFKRQRCYKKKKIVNDLQKEIKLKTSYFDKLKKLISYKNI